MKERPILFSGPMVRALLGGTKTQTRRIVKGTALEWLGPDGFTPEFVASEENHLCPYGQPGDRIWVRETWQGPLLDDDATENPTDIESTKYCFYAADGGPAPEYEDSDGDLHCRWRPSIHMPRWASRITLEITGVRVERLQDISEADAIAEGVDRFPGCRQDDDAAAFNRIGPVDNDSFPIARYAVLWESINGPGSWDANPWVWVVEFKNT